VKLVKANGQTSPAARGMPVDAGDRIVTGTDGMAQLTMVDQARLSLRPSTQFVIEAYGDRRDSEQGGVLNLLRGTLRTFTGLLSASNRDKFVMKTRVATVGIRGSGNILYACEEKECDESVSGVARVDGQITVNHTIDGSHVISGVTPASGRTTLVTGPGQTVFVSGTEAPRYIPTPRFIADLATNMTGAKAAAAAPVSGTNAETRNFSPSDIPALPESQQTNTPLVGNNGLGFPTVDASSNVLSDPVQLQDSVISAGSPLYGQFTPAGLISDGNFRGYRLVSQRRRHADDHRRHAHGQRHRRRRHRGDLVGPVQRRDVRFLRHRQRHAGSGQRPLDHGRPRDIRATSRRSSPGLRPYTLVGGTRPTNQNNVVGTLGSATLNVNFTDRTLGFNATVGIPAAGSAAAGNWTLNATNVPDRAQLVLRLDAGTASRSPTARGRAPRAGTISRAASRAASWALRSAGRSSGTASRTAPLRASPTGIPSAASRPLRARARTARRSTARDASRTPRVRSPSSSGPSRRRIVPTRSRWMRRIARPRSPRRRPRSACTPTIRSAPRRSSNPDSTPRRASCGDAGATERRPWTRGNQTQQYFLNGRSLHYIFAGTQAGSGGAAPHGHRRVRRDRPDEPTDFNGNVGTLNSASLNANFTNRTVDALVNITIAGQTWNAAANGMGIYRDQYFGAYSGTPIVGVPNPVPLVMSCTPNCGQGAAGSFDGFFAGRNGNRAGMMYNLGGNQGAVAFGRRGG
jgi:hypothetical protein